MLSQVKALEAAEAARRKEAAKAAERANQRAALEQQRADRQKRTLEAKVHHGYHPANRTNPHPALAAAAVLTASGTCGSTRCRCCMPVLGIRRQPVTLSVLIDRLGCRRAHMCRLPGACCADLPQRRP